MTSSMGVTDGQKPQESSSIGHLRSILQRVVRVTNPQGRIITGELLCMDKQGNLVLGKAQEEVPKAEPRQMGMVLVPLHQQKNVELQVALGEKLEHLSLQ